MKSLPHAMVAALPTRPAAPRRVRSAYQAGIRIWLVLVGGLMLAPMVGLAVFLVFHQRPGRHPKHYSTVTDFARFLGLSTSVPRAQAVW